MWDDMVDKQEMNGMDNYGMTGKGSSQEKDDRLSGIATESASQHPYGSFGQNTTTAPDLSLYVSDSNDDTQF